MPSARRLCSSLLIAFGLLAGAFVHAEQEGEADKYFNERVLPILRARCFECHGPDLERVKGRLRMNGREGLLKDALTGPAINVEKLEASLLLEAIRYDDPEYGMPPDGELPAEERAVLERWVLEGAPWPAEAATPAPTASELAAIKFFEAEIRPILAQHCFECHGPELDKVKSGLRMSSQAALLKGGDRGPAIVPGDAEASRLVHAIRYVDSDLSMPPTEKLGVAEIALIERWVASGAVWPGYGSAQHIDEEGVDLDAGRDWWSFRPVVQPAVPQVADAAFIVNPIDAFVLARLESAGLKPNPRAGERELVRRAYDDLIGIPPTYEELEAYTSDSGPDKWERLVDSLLARPQYGERQGRRWLDVVRFAQTNGYERDKEKPYAWRYRDWVIQDFNEDRGYDHFLAAQLAGDELPDARPEDAIATGFYHLGVWDSEPDDKLQAVYDGHDDVLRTISEGMLGVTLGCARCHDHKFDPFRQEDYFSLLAFVQNVEPYTKPEFSLESKTLRPVRVDAASETLWNEQRDARVIELQEEQEAILDAQRLTLIEERITEQSEEVQDAYWAPAEERTREQRKLLGGLAHLAPSPKEIQDSLPGRLRGELFMLKGEAERVASRSFEGGLPWALVARERGPVAEPTFVHGRGRVHSPLQEVEPAFLPALCANDEEARVELPDEYRSASSTGRRRQLAEWITSPANPTTARVMVNRVWRDHFGEGLVRTPNDFGATGMPPSHPELLDWLASEFVAGDWSVKELHRVIMRSSSYRMSSRATNEEALARDPSNELLWRQALRRLDAEGLHDALLAVSGGLVLEMGGRGYFPALSREALAGASKPGDGWELSELEERNRRAVYSFVKRGMIPPLLAVFDFADPGLPTGQRASTTIASQALTLLNGAFANRCARTLARRIMAEAGSDADARIARLFQLVLARDAEPAEVEKVRTWLEQVAENLEMLPNPLEFRSELPARLQTKFLAQVPDDGFLYGPSSGWSYGRGLWAGYYNDTWERDPERGPYALSDAPLFADGRLFARLVLRGGTEFAALALRARHDSERGELMGLELVLDPAVGEVRLVELAGRGAEPILLARAALTIEPERPYEIEFQARGARLSVRIDGDEILSTQGAGTLKAGGIAVRTWGETLTIEELFIEFAEGVELGEGSLRIEPPPPAPAAERALELLCLAFFNLNEFLYVD